VKERDGTVQKNLMGEIRMKRDQRESGGREKMLVELGHGGAKLAMNHKSSQTAGVKRGAEVPPCSQMCRGRCGGTVK